MKAPTSLLILAVMVVDIESAVETKTQVLETNSVGPADTYNLFKQCSQCWIDDHHVRKNYSDLYFKLFWNR